MNPSLQKLILAVVGYVVSHGGYINRTRLLKLLYLFDVEFYRVHGATFTGFHWKYFHLGPWTNEFNPVLSELISNDSLRERIDSRPEFDAKYLDAAERLDLKAPFDNYKDEAILKIVLDLWGSSSTGELLDYVYFRTEPMEHGVRNAPLDFSRIHQQSPERYKRVSSNKSPGEIKAMRRAFEKKLASVPKSTVVFTKPNYDQDFHTAMEKLDAGDL